MFDTPCKPAAFPRQAAFANGASYGIGGAGFATGYKRHKPAGFKGRSLRAAMVAAGYSPRRIAAKMAIAMVAMQSGAPLPWPRGFA
jgi:hypothetical protein